MLRLTVPPYMGQTRASISPDGLGVSALPLVDGAFSELVEAVMPSWRRLLAAIGFDSLFVQAGTNTARPSRATTHPARTGRCQEIVFVMMGSYEPALGGASARQRSLR